MDRLSDRWINGIILLSSSRQEGQGTHIWVLRQVEESQCFLSNQYTGSFVQGLRHGRGTFYHASGAIYEGEWRNNKSVSTVNQPGITCSPTTNPVPTPTTQLKMCSQTNIRSLKLLLHKIKNYLCQCFVYCFLIDTPLFLIRLVKVNYYMHSCSCLILLCIPGVDGRMDVLNVPYIMFSNYFAE